MKNETRARRGFHVPGRKVCATCGRVLDRNEALGVWQHPPGDPALAGHIPLPVDDTAVPVVERCDFCSAWGTDWVLPAESFQVGPGHASEGDWGACDDCAALIRANDWAGLFHRVKETWPGPEPITPEGQTWLVRTYAALQRNALGPIQRIER